MVISYKIHKSYHTSHHNTTKIHPPNSTLLNFQASSNAPTLTTLPPNHKQSQPFLPAIQRSADGSSNSRESTQSSSPHQSHTSARSPTQPPLPPARNRTAGETGAGWLRLCRRGADSWLVEICVVFQKFAV